MAGIEDEKSTLQQPAEPSTGTVQGDARTETRVEPALSSGLSHETKEDGTAVDPPQASRASTDAEGGSIPTAEDLATCSRAADTLPLATWMVAFVSLFERYAYYSCVTVFQNYIQNDIDDPLRPGALGHGQNLASLIVNCFLIASYLTPIGAAIIADLYLGRFRTLLYSFLAYGFGLTLLTITSVPSLLQRGAGLPGLILAMAFMSLGLGGVKSALPTFLAEQCSGTTQHVKTNKKGVRVVVDKEATVEYAFNVYYLLVNVGSQSMIPATLIEKHVDFWVTYLMAFCSISAGIFLLWFGRSHYIDFKPSGDNVLRPSLRAIWIAIRNGFRMEAARPQVVSSRASGAVSWDDDFISELSVALHACRVGIPFIVYWLCQAQLTTNTISQAGEMETHGIPNDLLPDLNAITVIFMLPLATHFLYPTLRKLKISFRPISRIALGFFIEALAMGWAAGVQGWIYRSGPCYDRPRKCAASLGGELPNRVNVAVQVPVYILEGLSEVFSNPAAYEFAYSNAPASMKSVLQAVFVLTAAAGSLLGLALTPVYHDPHLLAMFSALAAAMLLVSLATYVCFRKYAHKQESVTTGE